MNTIRNMINKLKADNQNLKREIKRLQLVNELNIVLLQDTKMQLNGPCVPCQPHFFDLAIAANDNT